MRNLPYHMSLKEAHESIDFSKLAKYDDMWVPLSLKAGDVMRADLPTYMKHKPQHRGFLGLDGQKYHNTKRDGFVNFNYHAGLYDPDSKKQLAPRNTLVLGLDLDADSYDIRYVRLARFTYSVDTHDDPETHPQFWPEEIGHFAKPVVFNGHKIDFVPFDSTAIGRMCDKPGTIVKTSALRKLEKALICSEDDRTFLPPDGLEGTIFVPALDPRQWKEAHDFDLAENESDAYKGTCFTHLDEAAQDELIEDALWLMAERINARRHQFMHERDERFRFEHRMKKRARTGYRNNHMRRIGLGDASAQERQEILGSVIDDLNKSDHALVDAIAATANEDDLKALQTPSGKRAGVNTLLERAAKKYQDASQKRKRLYTAACKGAPTEELLQEFSAVGVGGLKREPNIQIPGDLFRGRFMMLRIPDLLEPDQFAQDVHRPCVLWNAFWSMSKEGDLELAGMELYPCTRQGQNFQWRMGIQPPLNSLSTNPTYLIPEMMIRAPISAEYFQPQQHGANWFANLKVSAMSGFETKLQIFEEQVGEPRIFGLQERPKNWIPVDDKNFFTRPDDLNTGLRHKPRKRHSGGHKQQKTDHGDMVNIAPDVS